MKFSVSAVAVAASLFAGSAFAADLPSVKAPPPAPLPHFCWTGVYGGLNIGYGFGAGDPSTFAQTSYGVVGAFGPGLITTQPGFAGQQRTNLEGVIGGAQVGFNLQFNKWLTLGLETDFQGADLRSASTGGFVHGTPAAYPFLGTTNLVANTLTQSVDWWGTLRARVGVMPLSPNLMVYATGGLAYGGVRASVAHANVASFIAGQFQAYGASSFSDTKFGWTAGAGVEWAPMAMPNVSVKVEYLYTDLQNSRITTAGVGGGVGVWAAQQGVNSSTTEFNNRWHTVRVGVNYRFNFDSPVVIAKY